MSKIKSIQEATVSGRRVFVRCDFNVPLKAGEISDDSRIVAALPTIKLLIEKGAKVILASHLGRPKGKKDLAFTMAPVANSLSDLLGQTVQFVEDCIGPIAQKAVDSLQSGQVLLLENVRFYKGETDNDPEFARQLANFADVFVNDAFGTAHRAHASTAGLPATAATICVAY